MFIDRVLEQRARAHRSGTEGPAGAHGFVPHAHAHPGGGAGGATILDFPSGALSKGDQFVSLHQM